MSQNTHVDAILLFPKDLEGRKHLFDNPTAKWCKSAVSWHVCGIDWNLQCLQKVVCASAPAPPNFISDICLFNGLAGDAFSSAVGWSLARQIERNCRQYLTVPRQ